MLSATSFVGVGIQGDYRSADVHGMPLCRRSNNFVAADLNQLTGLKGNAFVKMDCYKRRRTNVLIKTTIRSAHTPREVNTV